jgi:hypothetical protein
VNGARNELARDGWLKWVRAVAPWPRALRFAVDPSDCLPGDFMSNRATQTVPQPPAAQSQSAPLACVQGTISKVFLNPEFHNNANHQHFVIWIDKVLKFEGTQNLVGTEVFVAVRFGDSEGLAHEIPGLQAGQPIEAQGEYISDASAYPTQDNSNPVLPVLHFTHHPVGYVKYQGQTYS